MRGGFWDYPYYRKLLPSEKVGMPERVKNKVQKTPCFNLANNALMHLVATFKRTYHGPLLGPRGRRHTLHQGPTWNGLQAKSQTGGCGAAKSTEHWNLQKLPTLIDELTWTRSIRTCLERRERRRWLSPLRVALISCQRIASFIVSPVPFSMIYVQATVKQ